MDIISYLKEKAKKNLEKNKSDREAYEKGLKELEEFMSDKNPSSNTPSYERFEYDSPSDEEIRKSAEDELQGYLDSNERAIRNEYAEREKDLNKSKESSKALYDESSEKLKDAYETASEALGNDALKRGLARSSIALNGQLAASKAYGDSVASLVDEYDRKIADIDRELDSLGSELSSALDSFRIDYAAKLTSRINELKAEREKSEREAIEYNNKLLEKEYNERTAASKSSNSSSKKTQNAAYQKALFDKINEIFGSLSPEQAKRMFNENREMFRENLGDVYYYSLYTRYN